MAKKGLSKSQKRKQKLAKRKPKTSRESLIKKYESPRFVKALMHAEIGIMESDVMTDGEMTDPHVTDALRALIQELQATPELRPPSSDEELESYEALIISNIKRQWLKLFQTESRHPNKDLAGISRKIISSVKSRSTASARSRGYLDYIRGFLGQFGFNARRLSVEEIEQLGLGEIDLDRVDIKTRF